MKQISIRPGRNLQAAPYGYALPEGWTMVARGVWEHENGARVEHTGSSPKYTMVDPDRVTACADSRAAAFHWAQGDVL
mgnify:CR=1 FL=1